MGKGRKKLPTELKKMKGINLQLSGKYQPICLACGGVVVGLWLCWMAWSVGRGLKANLGGSTGIPPPSHRGVRRVGFDGDLRVY